MTGIFLFNIFWAYLILFRVSPPRVRRKQPSFPNLNEIGNEGRLLGAPFITYPILQ
jgi:hypothetical protein